MIKEALGRLRGMHDTRGVLVYTATGGTMARYILNADKGWTTWNVECKNYSATRLALLQAAYGQMRKTKMLNYKQHSIQHNIQHNINVALRTVQQRNV